MPTKSLKLSILVCICANLFGCKPRLNSTNDSGVLFYGADNTQARLVFEGYFYMDPPSSEDEKDYGHTALVRDAAHEELMHLFGVFKDHPAFKATPGIPFGAPETDIVKEENTTIDGKPKIKVTYAYRDLTVFSKAIFGNSNSPKKIQIRLPLDPSTIYALGSHEEPKKDDKGDIVKDDKGNPVMITRNTCTDEQYNSEGDFWYFWNPDKPGCPPAMKAATLAIDATLTPIPNTTSTYPDYKRLGKDHVIKIFAVQGLLKSYSSQDIIDEKYADDDEGVHSYLKQIDYMTKTMGFKVTDDISPYYKVLTLKKGQNTYIVETALMDSSIHSIRSGYSDTTKARIIAIHRRFEDFVRKGMAEGDIFTYSGHSGLGGNIPVSRFDLPDAPFTLPNKYQIFLFNGCSTFSYYRSPYVQLKQQAGSDPNGTYNLDVITSAQETYFQIHPQVFETLLTAITSETYPSFQTILNNIYYATKVAGYDPRRYSGEYHISGDEDNPKTKSEAMPR